MSCTIGTSNIGNIANFATCLISHSVIPLIFALAVAAFVWGVIKFFILNADEEAKRSQGKQFMIWGLIALAVALSLWGIVRILGNTFVPNANTSVLPGVRPPGAVSNGNPGDGGGPPPCDDDPDTLDIPDCL